MISAINCLPVCLYFRLFLLSETIFSGHLPLKCSSSAALLNGFSLVAHMVPVSAFRFVWFKLYNLVLFSYSFTLFWSFPTWSSSVFFCFHLSWTSFVPAYFSLFTLILFCFIITIINHHHHCHRYYHLFIFLSAFPLQSASFLLSLLSPETTRAMNSWSDYWLRLGELSPLDMSFSIGGHWASSSSSFSFVCSVGI